MLLAPTAQAQWFANSCFNDDDALVGNLNQSQAGGVRFGNTDQAQPFTTGPNPTGYTLLRVEAEFAGRGSRDSGDFGTGIHEDDGGKPGRRLKSLHKRDVASDQACLQAVALGGGFHLEPNTTYWFEINASRNIDAFNPSLRTTNSDMADPRGADGFTLGTRLAKVWDASSDDWATQSNPLKLRLVGVPREVPPGIVVPPTLRFAEGFTTAADDRPRFPVRLATAPSGDVTVTVREWGVRELGGGDHLNFDGATSLTFTPANWDQPQELRAGTPGDRNDVDDVVTLRYNASGGGYDSVFADQRVEVIDGSIQRVFLIVPKNSRIEEGKSVEFRVNLARNVIAGQTVVVPFSVSGPGVDGPMDGARGLVPILPYPGDFDVALKDGACTGGALGELDNMSYPAYNEANFSPVLPRDQWRVLTFTGGSGVRNCTLVLTALQDGAIEPTETFTLRLAQDDDNASRNGIDHLNTAFPVNVDPDANSGSVTVTKSDGRKDLFVVPERDYYTINEGDTIDIRLRVIRKREKAFKVKYTIERVGNSPDLLGPGNFSILNRESTIPFSSIATLSNALSALSVVNTQNGFAGGDGVYKIRLSSDDPDVEFYEHSNPIYLKIKNNDSTVVKFDDPASVTREGVGTHNVRMTLTPPPDSDISVNFFLRRFADFPEATPTVDYNFLDTSGIVTGSSITERPLKPGSNVQVFTRYSIEVAANTATLDLPIFIVDDSVSDSGERIGLVLDAGEGYLNSAVRYYPEVDGWSSHYVTIYNHEYGDLPGHVQAQIDAAGDAAERNRWRRALAALRGEAPPDGLAAMTGAEARRLADSLWSGGDKDTSMLWLAVAESLRENPPPDTGTGTSVGTGTSTETDTNTGTTPNPHADLIADAEKAVTETDKGEIHVDRWRRVLAALGVDNGHTPMPASEAQGYVDRGWTRWVPVAAALAEIESGTQPEPETQPTTETKTEPVRCVSDELKADVTGWSQETVSTNTELQSAYVERWLRVLQTFAGTANDSTIMLPAEARTYRDKGWARWIPVVTALECLEEGAAE